MDPMDQRDQRDLTTPAKACEACRTAKRRCTRRTPACDRCQKRGLACHYLPSQSFFVYGVGNGASHRAQAVGLESASRRWQHGYQYRPQLTCKTSNIAEDFCSSDSNSEVTVHPYLARPSIADLQSAWFLTPEAWVISPLETDNHPPVTTSMLKRFIKKTTGWLKDWVQKGSSPLMHAELYKRRCPRCIQDAFTTLSAYASRTPGTDPMVYRVLEDRSEDLVKSEGESRREALDAFEHLSRVQSLMTYLIIRLWDGDIRQRHLAEKHLPTLDIWTRQMLDCAGEVATNGKMLTSNYLKGDEACPVEIDKAKCDEDPEKLLWHAWILAESIRRTWAISESVRSIYSIMQMGEVECPGGMMVTTRRGAWEAESAYAWTKTCAEQTVGFMRRSETERVLYECEPADIDQFTLVLLELDHGTEKMERWGADLSS